MTQAPLLEYLAAHERLMDWWEGFLADCAKRRTARENTLSARALLLIPFIAALVLAVWFMVRR